jgi:predicted nucleotidyltransferase
MLDYISLFKRLNDEKINYIVVGGIAVNLHGIPRMTYDVDLLIDFEGENLNKFLNLLNEWGFKPKAPVNIMDFAIKSKREEWIKQKNMKAFNLVNPAWAISEIDIIIDAPVDYTKAEKHVKRIAIGDVAIPTISIPDLIKMKQKAGRQQDKTDITYLRTLKK